MSHGPRNVASGPIATAALISLALVSACFTAGCATMLYGSTDEVLFNTAPQGATVRSGGRSCTTPCHLRIDKKETEVSITKPGYDEQIVPLRKRIHAGGYVFGNLPTVGLGMIVDSVTGGKYAVQPVDVVLSRAN